MMPQMTVVASQLNHTYLKGESLLSVFLALAGSVYAHLSARKLPELTPCNETDEPV